MLINSEVNGRHVWIIPTDELRLAWRHQFNSCSWPKAPGGIKDQHTRNNVPKKQKTESERGILTNIGHYNLSASQVSLQIKSHVPREKNALKTVQALASWQHHRLTSWRSLHVHQIQKAFSFTDRHRQRKLCQDNKKLNFLTRRKHTLSLDIPPINAANASS